jgi:hypothetical protein
VHIGISLGDVTWEQGDCFGTPVIESAYFGEHDTSAASLPSEQLHGSMKRASEYCSTEYFHRGPGNEIRRPKRRSPGNRWGSRRSVYRAMPVILGALLCAGCGPYARRTVSPVAREARVEVLQLPCGEATAVARSALWAMHFNLEQAARERSAVVRGTFTPADPPADPNQGPWYVVRVTLRCSELGVEFIITVEEERGAPLAVQPIAAAIARFGNRRLVGRTVTGVPPGYAQPFTLLVEAELLRSLAAVETFGVDLPAMGVSPVRLTLRNRSSHAYRFRSDAIELVGDHGQHVVPLSPASLATRIAATDASGLEWRLQDRTLASQGEIKPFERVSGYLFFGTDAYRSAQITADNSDTQTPELFEVEFHID